MISTTFILEYIVPGLGLIMANLMYLAPVKDLNASVQNGTGLDKLNPTPWAFLLGKCLGWAAYGVITNNWIVFWGDYPGFLIACWLNLGAVKLIYSSHHQNETRISMMNFLVENDKRISELKQDNRRLSLMCSKATNIISPIDDGKLDESDHERDLNGDDGNETIVDEESNETIVDEEINEKRDESTSRNNNMEFDVAVATDPASENQAEKLLRWGRIIWDVTSQKTPAKVPHEQLILGIILAWSIILTFVGFWNHFVIRVEGGDSFQVREKEVCNPLNWSLDCVGQNVVGWIVVFNQVFFFGAPLSRIKKILKARNSDELHLPTMVMNNLNSAMWVIIGASLRDPFVYAPATMGLVFSLIQVFLYLVFPKSTKERKSMKPDDIDKSEKTIGECSIDVESQ